MPGDTRSWPDFDPLAFGNRGADPRIVGAEHAEPAGDE
jgi:hypothetical protein